MRRYLYASTLCFAVALLAASLAWCEESLAPFPAAQRLQEAQQAKAQADALVAELERELSLARFSSQQAGRAMEALQEVQRLTAPKAEEAKP